jgi:hypothetical protein
VIHVVTKQIEWRFRLQRTFFGLSDKYIESVYEEFFILKYHGGWSFTEAYNLPITIRRWFLEKLVNQIKKEKEAMEKAAKGSRSSGKR